MIIRLPSVVVFASERLDILISGFWIVTISEEPSCNGMLNGINLFLIESSVLTEHPPHDWEVIIDKWSLRINSILLFERLVLWEKIYFNNYANK